MFVSVWATKQIWDISSFFSKAVFQKQIPLCGIYEPWRSESIVTVPVSKKRQANSNQWRETEKQIKEVRLSCCSSRTFCQPTAHALNPSLTKWELVAEALYYWLFTHPFTHLDHSCEYVLVHCNFVYNLCMNLHFVSSPLWEMYVDLVGKSIT